MKSALLLLIAGFAFGAQTQPPFSELRTRSIHGDRDVRFHFKNENGEVTVQRLIDGRDRRMRNLKIKEWNFLVSEFKKLPQAPQIPPECARNRLDIIYVENEAKTMRGSCFGVKTITSDEYVRFAQILALVF